MDAKTEHIAQGIASVGEGIKVAMADARRALEQRRGATACVKRFEERLLAEVKKLGDDVRARLEAGELEGEELAHYKGRIKGLELANASLLEFKAEVLREQQEQAGRVDALAQMAEKVEQQRTGLLSKAERREREAEENEATREDGAPAPYRREPVADEKV